ncbi:MAG: hypothetical protein AAF288_04595 [Planctomycetota bacterium]
MKLLKAYWWVIPCLAFGLWLGIGKHKQGEERREQVAEISERLDRLGRSGSGSAATGSANTPSPIGGAATAPATQGAVTQTQAQTRTQPRSDSPLAPGRFATGVSALPNEWERAEASILSMEGLGRVQNEGKERFVLDAGGTYRTSGAYATVLTMEGRSPVVVTYREQESGRWRMDGQELVLTAESSTVTPIGDAWRNQTRGDAVLRSAVEDLLAPAAQGEELRYELVSADRGQMRLRLKLDVLDRPGVTLTPEVFTYTAAGGDDVVRFTPGGVSE